MSQIETVAMGCLSNPTWQGLMRHTKMPVAMTSANLSGQADGVVDGIDHPIQLYI
ncbi:hypothetical protein [Bacillus methanolicus]|uniref:hypothetical protein n=1 Tax=Bacillus methanolicus TaxID=1471 RepID=UPI00237FDD33|nr:hypothetical protein [Bacillus methanolicus]